MKCRHCGSTENLHIDVRRYNKYRRPWIGYSCRSCTTERIRKYRQTSSGKEVVLRAVKKYESTHKQRRPAWIKAYQIKSQPCLECGKIKTHRHHPDINKPLEVIFLCPFHHKRAHIKERLNMI